MSISSEVRRAGPYSGNGSTTAFAFAFKVFTTAQVVVTRTVLGVETTLTLTTDYTVTLNANQNTNPGGTVTMLTAPATGQSITITSNVANLQPTAIANLGGFYPEVINDSLDRATIQIQQLDERVDRALVIPVSSSGVSTQLPAPEASKILGWNGTGTAVINYTTLPPSGEIYPVATYAALTATPVANLQDDMLFYVASRSSENDGGAGVWRYDAASTTTADGGTILARDGGGAGRFIRLRQQGELKAEWFGYKADAVIFGDGAITSGDNTLTATGAFTANSVGKLIVVFGAGAAGADLVTTIASYNSAGSVELTAAAGTTVSGKTGGWGTDNASALALIATAAIAAYGARVVYPAGDALTSATHDFPDAQYLALRGLGQGVTRLWSTSATADLIHVRATTSGTPVFNFSIDDITLRRLRSDVTAGAGLRLTHCNTFSIGQNVTALDHFTSYDFESAVIGVHMGDLQSGAFWASVKTGSVGQLYRQKSGYPTCAEIRIPAVHARSSGNNRLDYGIRIRGADGLFFEGGYVGFCNEAAIALEPETISTQLSGVHIDGVWADETTKYGVKVQTPSSYSAVFGDHSIKITKCYNCDQAAVFWDCENAGTTENSLIEVDQAFHLGKHGVWITDASRLTVNVVSESIAEASAASGVYVDGTVSDLTIWSDCSKVGSNTPDAAVYFHSTAAVGDRVSVAWRANQTTYDAVFGQSTGVVDVRGEECISSRDHATYVANASGVLDSGLATSILCSGLTAPATGIGSWTIPTGLRGLRRTVRFTGSVDVFDVNDLVIAGTFSATANDILEVEANGGNNYEVSRSAN
jgi:hypothetical protein